MITKENYTNEHITNLRKNCHSDPQIIERTIYAFGLLEALARVGTPFVFKGGTCLMLLLDTPRRLSTDIDIVVEPDINIHYLSYFRKINPEAYAYVIMLNRIYQERI